MKLNLPSSSGGFSLLELMVVLALIGTLSAVVILPSTLNWRRQRSNAVAQELAGWIEEVMAYSMRNNSQCQVRISTAAELAAGATAATIANPAVCAVRKPNFRIPSLLAGAGDRYRLGSFNIESGAADNVIIYTPRGAVDNDYDIQILMAVKPAGALATQSPLRCVRISDTLGLISVGRNDGASDPTLVANACTNFASI